MSGRKKKVENDSNSMSQSNKTTIFDVISYLTYNKRKWNELTTEEQNLFVPYMINRFLSMDLTLCEAVNQLQQYTLNVMSKKDVYMLYYYLLPKQKYYLKYIKSNKEISDKDLQILMEYYNLSRRECEDYYLILTKDDEGMKKFEDIKENFKYSQNKIK